MAKLSNAKVVYFVLAKRWNDRYWELADSYVVGVFHKTQQAIKCAEIEEDRCGHKYGCFVYKIELNVYDEQTGASSECIRKGKAINLRTGIVEEFPYGG